FHRYPEGFHLAVKVAAFHAENLRGAAHIAFALLELSQNEVAFVGGPRLVQRSELRRYHAAALAIDKRRQVLALDLRGARIHDDNALDYIAQLAHISR